MRVLLCLCVAASVACESPTSAAPATTLVVVLEPWQDDTPGEPGDPVSMPQSPAGSFALTLRAPSDVDHKTFTVAMPGENALEVAPDSYLLSVSSEEIEHPGCIGNALGPCWGSRWTGQSEEHVVVEEGETVTFTLEVRPECSCPA